VRRQVVFPFRSFNWQLKTLPKDSLMSLSKRIPTSPSSRKLPTTFVVIIFLLQALFLATASNAGADMRQINISWDYPAFWIDNLEGFVLYRDGIEICATSDPLSRRMVCEINVGTAPIYFTMTAYDTSGNESRLSESFVLQPPAIISESDVSDTSVPQAPTSSDAIIIDNGDSASRSIGSWNPSTGLNSYGTQSVFTKNPGSEYIFEKTLNGSYEVSLWWTVTASRCSNVPVEIYDGSTLIDTVYVDQNMDGGTWNILGVYDFYGSGAVSIVSNGGCSTSADAVKFQQ
jgi:hypothetical protein